ncbi:MAG TPA: carboxypeptidase-like regulatory domain-containing protein, partial [Chitinophagaceae bacterium]|nr:carboxypeptidase-like regulatory domain-containing protein [Chitinophagaceae bacterium]
MRRVVLFFATLLLVAFNAITGYGQETTADIQGFVSDGSVGLAGATVVATHTPTGTVYSTTSRKDGRYNFANVRVGGPYEIKVTYAGFKED